MSKPSQLESPVAFMIFNRPGLTAQVFKKIAAQRPKKLLVIADGPRTDAEREICAQTRAVLDTIDWDCELLTNFSDVNLGCKKRVSSGLDWVFSTVEEAIVLEDDCLPSDSFFSYCQTLLERYRFDERVMVIAGSNFQQGQSRTPYSYYFSKLNLVWGWASWARAWKHYDVNMSSWPEFRDSGLLKGFCDLPEEEAHWLNTFNTTHAGLIDTWDFQWFYKCWEQSGFTVTPDKNLISNLGFGPGATHTVSVDSPLAGQPIHEIWDIKHPQIIARHKEADEFAIRNCYIPKPEETAVPAANTIENVSSEPERATVANEVLAQARTKKGFFAKIFG